MTLSLPTKNLGLRFIPVLGDERRPLCMGDFAIVDSADIKEREPSFAPEGVAGEDVGEDRSSVRLVRPTSHDRFVCCDHLLALT